MALRRKSVLLIALLVVLSLVAAACGGDGGGTTGGGDQGEDTTEPVKGGTLIFGAEQEPSEGLNGNLTCCTLFWDSVIMNQVFEGAYKVLPDFSYEPNLIEGEAEVTEDPFTITYNIRDEAQWNDGTPVSADDFAFTVETYVDPKNDIASRAGYDMITDTEIIDEKTVTFTFKEPYAGYKELFSSASWLLPKHALEGEDFNKVWNNEILNPKTGEPIGNGPFLFESYNKGSDLTLVRNEEYWGEHTAYLDEITFQFILETSAEIQALQGGEVDAIYPQPQLELSTIVNDPQFTVETNLGTTWEHLDMQFSNPLLKEQFVREAIGYGIDREALTTQLFKDISPDTVPLNNMIFLTNSEFYEEHFDTYSYDPDKARGLLEDNGCTEGSGGIYECNGQPLEFGFTSTAGNALRELGFEIMQAQLKDVGIAINNEFGDAAVVFGNQGLAGGKYDLFNFAWVGSPDPAGSVEIHKCEGSQNFQNYCNEEATSLLEESDTLVDPAERAAALNQADELMAADIPILPLYQKPTFFAYTTRLHGAEDNPTQDGPTWNSEEWFLTEE